MGITAIIKPTHDCNYACSYCYVDKNAEKGRMSKKTLFNAIEQTVYVNKLSNSIPSFIWHGGEPLLRSIEFYELIVKYQKQHTYPLVHISKTFKHGITNIHISEVFYSIRNSVQSNLSLLTEEHISIFKNNNFKVGTSLDGPETINNLTRTLKDGNGSFNLTYNKLKKAISQNIGGGVIIILTKNNINEIPKIYNFFKNENIDIKLNPLIKSGSAISNYNNLCISPKEYGAALIQIFDLWYHDQETDIDIAPLSEMIGNLITNKTQSCNFSKSCQNSFISIGPEGDIYPCGRFDGIEEFKLGNINRDNLNNILCSNLRNKLNSREIVSECRVCRFKMICNSGCMHNAYMANKNIFKKDYYCLSNIMILDHIYKEIQNQLTNARESNNIYN